MILLVQKTDGSHLRIDVDCDTVEPDPDLAGANNALPWIAKKGDIIVARFGHIFGWIADAKSFQEMAKEQTQLPAPDPATAEAAEPLEAPA